MNYMNDIHNKLRILSRSIINTITTTTISIIITHPSPPKIYQALLNTHKKKNASK